jgi:hypothetical protein
MVTENDASLVRLIKDGRIFLGPYGAAVPTGHTFTPSAEYSDVGYYSEDGFTLTPEPGDNLQIMGHNKDIVFDEDEPGRWVYAFSGIQDGRPITECYFDTEVDPADGSYTVTSAAASTYRSLILIGEGSNGETILSHAPRVKVTDREAVTFNSTTLQALGMSFGTFRDSATASPYQFRTWNSALIEAV